MCQCFPREISSRLAEKFIRRATRQSSIRCIRKRNLSVGIGGRNSKRKRLSGGSKKGSRSTRQTGQHLATL